MKETPLNNAFEKATRALEADRCQKNVARQLSMLQAVATDFQQENMDVTLQVRPGAEGFPLAGQDHGDVAEDKMLANAALSIDGIRLDVVLQKGDDYYDGAMELKIFRGQELLLTRGSTYNEDKKRWEDDEPEEEYHEETGKALPKVNPRKAVTALLLDIKVRKDFVSRYDVGPNAANGSSIEKPIGLGTQLFRKPEPPPGSP